MRRFYFRYSIGGERVALPLGEYARKRLPGLLTLAEARAIAIRYAALHRDPTTRDVKQHLSASELRGRRPVVQANAPPLPDTATKDGSQSLLALCNLYADGLTKREAQSAPLVKNQIKNHIAPTQWAAYSARDVTSKDITALLRLMVGAGKGPTAIKVRRLLHAAYAQAIKSTLDPNSPAGMDAFDISFNPVSATASLSELSTPGKRALNKQELSEFWRAVTDSSEDMSLPIRAIRVSTLLGGQRALQLLRCTTDSVDLTEGTITLLDGKGNRQLPRVHLLPVAHGVRKEIKWLLQHSKNLGCPFLFAGRARDKHLREGPVSKAVLALSRRLQASGAFKASFKYADLRRTAETHMAALRISKDVRAQILSHGLSGVQDRHYDCHDYLQEKTDALVQWESYLTERLTAEAEPNA